jgi:hypothetical protein
MESNKNKFLIKSKTKQENGELNEFIKNKEQKKIKILFEEPKNSLENKDQINVESSELSFSSERRFSRASNRKLSSMCKIGDDNISQEGKNWLKLIGMRFWMNQYENYFILPQNIKVSKEILSAVILLSKYKPEEIISILN